MLDAGAGGGGRWAVFLAAWCAGCPSGTRLDGEASGRDDGSDTPESADTDGGMLDGDALPRDDVGDAEVDVVETEDGASVPAVCGDGIVEPPEECDSEPPRACTTSCGVATRQRCIGCRWEAVCCASVEACGNGCDDNCDTLTDEHACDLGSPCTTDDECAPGGLVCNENWGICVVPSCAGQPDFTPCEAVTTPADRAYDICSDEMCLSPGCGDANCNAPGPNWTLPHTSQRYCRCFEGSFSTWCEPCSGGAGTEACATTPYCGQDGQYGWDAGHAQSERFTRTAGEEPIVTDNVTGLVWQGCLAGRTGASCEGSRRGFTWDDAVQYCDSLTWGGFADWTLPDRYQLLSIVHFGVRSWLPYVFIDLDAFPATDPDIMWSLSSCAGSSFDAWVVSFGSSSGPRVDGEAKSNGVFVRCVRAAVPAVRREATRFTRTFPAGPDQPIVADGATGLIWQGCPAGQSGPDCAGEATLFIPEEALAYCEGLDWAGYADWYLPNLFEVTSIVDDRRAGPSLDTAIFPPDDRLSARYWSSTIFPDCWPSADCTATWCVDFNDGRVVRESARMPRVRCVRHGR